MMKYRVVEGCSAGDLQFKVQQALDEGWVPQGGVAMCFLTNRSERAFAQAMVLQQ